MRGMPGDVISRSIYLPAALIAAPRRDGAALLCEASDGDGELVPVSASFLPLRTKRTESLSSEEEGETELSYSNNSSIFKSR